MILWAHLMVTYLSIQALSPNQRLEAVNSTSDPKGIDEMYDRIATAIFEQSDIEGSIAKQTIMMLAFATHDLTSDDLEVALNVANGIFSLSKEDRIINFNETVITICGGIIEPVQLYSPIHGQRISTFQFIHLSAKHYFVESPDSRTLPSLSQPGRAFLFASEALSHLQIAQICVALLRNCAPGGPFGREMPSHYNLQKSSAMEDMKPFVRYATRSWIKHLEKADTRKLCEATDPHYLEVASQLMKDLHSFLCSPAAISAWIEETYRIKIKPEAQRLVGWVSKLLQQRQPPNGFDPSILKLSLELSRDLQKLEKFWGQHLWKEPGCIWDEASAFVNSKFLRKPSDTQVRSIVRAIADDDAAETTCKTCLCKISSTNESGDLAAVLSVWPSRYVNQSTFRLPLTFAESTKQLSNSASCQRLGKSSESCAVTGALVMKSGLLTRTQNRFTSWSSNWMWMRSNFKFSTHSLTGSYNFRSVYRRPQIFSLYYGPFSKSHERGKGA